MTDYSFWGSTKNKWFFHLFLFMGFCVFYCLWVFVFSIVYGFSVFSCHLNTHQGHTGCRREIGGEEVL